MPRERQTTAAVKRNQGGLCWLSGCSPDEHSFCQAVCGTFPRCSQWHFRDSAIANLRHILSLAETGSLEDHEREPSDDDQDDPLL